MHTTHMLEQERGKMNWMVKNVQRQPLNTFIIAIWLYNIPTVWFLSSSLFCLWVNPRTENQIICPSSHNWQVVDPGYKPTQQDSTPWKPNMHLRLLTYLHFYCLEMHKWSDTSPLMCLNISQTGTRGTLFPGIFHPWPEKLETDWRLITAFLSWRWTVSINILRLSVIKKLLIKINHLALIKKQIYLCMERT